MSIFYSKESKQQLLKYADAGYLSDPYKTISQTRCMFNYNGTTISWRFFKQTMVATSSNHLEIVAIHEASHEGIWLRSMIQYIQELYRLPSIKDNPTTLFKDDVTLHKSKEIISKEIERKTSLQSSFTHMNSKRVVKLMFSKYAQVII